MPQATPELRAEWPDGDFQAWEHLNGRFKDNGGGIIYPLEGVEPTEKDLSAISYLVQEWDYDYSETKPPMQVSPKVAALIEALLEARMYIESEYLNTQHRAKRKNWFDGLMRLTNALKPYRELPNVAEALRDWRD